MKIIKWLLDNILFALTLFLLAFIPLYPKKPIVDIQHTWVYIRAEDFVVVFVLLVWLLLLLRKKIILKTPLTLPIIVFWIIGAIATMHGVLLIFPLLSDVFPNVAFLSFLRRIEYMSLFFVAYSGMKDKRFIPYVVLVLAMTLLFVTGYGFGQKFYGFPAYLTMNEEFAKGIPVYLSQLSRIPSTFGGHYDLAAYLVLIIPLLTSMIFGFRNWFVRLGLLTTIVLGFTLLFMTVSRVSFFALLVSLIMLLLFQKKRLAIFSLLFMAFISIILLSFFPSLSQRFGNTIKEVDVLVSANTGDVIGHVKEVPAKYFENKIIKIKFAQSKDEIGAIDNTQSASTSAIVIVSQIPPYVPLVVESNSPTGENLPQGTGYINLSLSPITQKLTQIFYQKVNDKGGTTSAEIFNVHGDFLVKRALAYDLSFTTRFQGEWPHAITAFERNILLGSGYASVSLAVDNNYLRILAEVGLLGFSSFFAIFLILGIYIKKILPEIDSSITKSFVLGFVAGLFGLALNAVLIDVFEASKIAFLLWLLIGITFGILHLYQKRDIDLYQELKKAIISTPAIIAYLFIFTAVFYLPMANYYFAGDDFTWFRWMADCNNSMGGPQQCQPIMTRIFHFFTDSNGFFYRPGTKVYFLLMYSGFWLNQTVYHVVSVLLHFTVAMFLFLIAKKVLKDFFLSVLAAFLFLILSSYSEAVFWISSTGFLFNAVFALLSLLFYILWKEKKKNIFFILSMLSIVFSLLFHELGVVTPLLIMLYAFTFEEKFTFNRLFSKSHYLLLLFPILPYLGLRFFANSHWFNGDYSYNLLKLPYNVVGNTIGYTFLGFFGPASLPFYQLLRNFSKEHLLLSAPFCIVAVYVLVMAYRMVIRKMAKEEQKIVIFGFLFFIIALLPFLGLGNIASRYNYLSSVGFIFLFVFFLKKLYGYLMSNGRYITFASVTAIICIFSLTHLIQLQKIHGDWHEVGEKSKKFLISLDKEYTNEPLQLYFVNVPIRLGEAWIFPVGLPDAVWLTFRREDITVSIAKSLDFALDQAEGSSSARVLTFMEDGSLRLVTRSKKTKIIEMHDQ